MSEWKPGLPPGKYYKGMENDFEVRFTVMGVKWHRKLSEEEKRAHIAAREASTLSSQHHSTEAG